MMEEDARDMMAVVSALIHHSDNGGPSPVVVFDQACGRNSELRAPLRQLATVFGALFMDMEFLEHVQFRQMDALNMVLPWNDHVIATSHDVNIAACVAAATHNASLFTHIGSSGVSDIALLCCVMDAASAIDMLVHAIDRVPPSIRSEVSEVLNLVLCSGGGDDNSSRGSYFRQKSMLADMAAVGGSSSSANKVHALHYLLRCWMGCTAQRNELVGVVLDSTPDPDALCEALQYAVVDRHNSMWALDAMLNKHGVCDTRDNAALKQACAVSNFGAIRMLLQAYNPDNAAYPLDAANGLLACRNILVATNHATHPYVAMYLDPAIGRHILGRQPPPP